jgi:hypothetical protein
VVGGAEASKGRKGIQISGGGIVDEQVELDF